MGWQKWLDKHQLASIYRSADTVAKKMIFWKAQIRTITGWEEGLNKRQLASTYRYGDTAAQGILIVLKLKFALSQGGKKD